MINLFSKRNKQPKDMFIYDQLPQNFRNQVVHILISSLGKYNPPNYLGHGALPSNLSWEYIHNQLCREYGVFQLSEAGNYPAEKCVAFIQQAKVEQVLDIIELSFGFVERVVYQMNEFDKSKSQITQSASSAIYELNERFKEHGIGYQYTNGQIVRVDSDYIYQEAVKPAVDLLFSEGFEGASEEFMKAHEHFRKGDNKAAVTEAGKAFESVMKTICIKMKWKLPPKQNANLLIKTLSENGLFPTWLENSMLGLTTLRNNLTAHGQGEKVVKIPRHAVTYALHLCASNIVFLIDSYKEKTKW